MIAGSILLGLAAMVSYGLANTFAMPLAKRLGAVRMLLLRGLAVCAILFVISLPSLGRLADEWPMALAAFAIGLFGYLPPLAFTHGTKVSRISIVAPIAGTAPFLTVLLSTWFLRTHLHGVQWAGIAVIIAANIAVSLNFRSWRDSNILKLASGVPFGLVAAVLWGLVAFLIVYPTRSLGPWAAAFLMELGVVAAASFHLALRREPFKLKEVLNRSVLINALLIATGTLAFTVGIKSFNIGLVAALSNSTALVSIIAATIIHHEHLTWAEKTLAACMMVDVILISVA